MKIKNKHHLRPKSRGGKKVTSNLLTIDIDKHRYWHAVFGNRTLEEIINVLQKLKRLKALYGD